MEPEAESKGIQRSEERDLMLRARGGDRAAFGALTTRHMQRAYFVALGLVGCREDAQDLSQEAFARLYRHCESLDPERPFFGLLYYVLRRLCFNHLRDTKTRRMRLAEHIAWLTDDAGTRSEGSDPRRQVELQELRERLGAGIAALTDKEREVIVLKEFDGLRYREISELLEIPIGTVMSRLYSARRALARMLEGT